MWNGERLTSCEVGQEKRHDRSGGCRRGCGAGQVRLWGKQAAAIAAAAAVAHYVICTSIQLAQPLASSAGPCATSPRPHPPHISTHVPYMKTYVYLSALGCSCTRYSFVLPTVRQRKAGQSDNPACLAAPEMHGLVYRSSGIPGSRYTGIPIAERLSRLLVLVRMCTYGLRAVT